MLKAFWTVLKALRAFWMVLRVLKALRMVPLGCTQSGLRRDPRLEVHAVALASSQHFATQHILNFIPSVGCNLEIIRLQKLVLSLSTGAIPCRSVGLHC